MWCCYRSRNSHHIGKIECFLYTERFKSGVFINPDNVAVVINKVQTEINEDTNNYEVIKQNTGTVIVQASNLLSHIGFYTMTDGGKHCFCLTL